MLENIEITGGYGNNNIFSVDDFKRMIQRYNIPTIAIDENKKYMIIIPVHKDENGNYKDMDEYDEWIKELCHIYKNLEVKIVDKKWFGDKFKDVAVYVMLAPEYFLNMPKLTFEEDII